MVSITQQQDCIASLFTPANFDTGIEEKSPFCLLLTAISVDIDGTPTSITGLLNQDGQFLHVEGITTDDDNVYLTSDSGDALTYIGMEIT